MQTLWQDIRYGLRMLSSDVGFTAIAVIALALGIGANTAIFSVVNAVLLRPLPYRDAERIVAIQELNKEGKRGLVTPANFLDWRAQNTVFQHLAAIFEGTSNLTGENEAERVNLAITSANFFDVFGVQPLYGRFFLPQDEQAGHPAIAVISYGLWQRRYGGEAEIVGKSMTLDGKSYTVAGLHHAGSSTPRKPRSGCRRQAKGEMESITARLRKEYPETNNSRFNRVVTLHKHLVGDTMHGRAFQERDNASTRVGVLINQATADRNFAGENPICKRINFGGVDQNNQPVWSEILGVVANVRALS